MSSGFRRGDRVASKIGGYYMGIPGRIIGPSQMQFGYGMRYTIELDIGKTIALREQYIEKLKEKHEGER